MNRNISKLTFLFTWDLSSKNLRFKKIIRFVFFVVIVISAKDLISKINAFEM